MLVVRAALAGKSLPASQRVLALRQHARAGAASRYALGAGGVGAAHPAPAASLTSASRYALGARRTALRADIIILTREGWAAELNEQTYCTTRGR